MFHSRKVQPLIDKAARLELADNSIRMFMIATFKGSETCATLHPRMQIYRKARELLQKLQSQSFNGYEDEFQEGIDALLNIGTIASFSHPLINENPSFLGRVYNFFCSFMILSDPHENENEAIFEDEEERDNPVCFEAQDDSLAWREGSLHNAYYDSAIQGKGLY